MALMQGYDAQAAEGYIARIMRKEGVRAPQDELLGFIRRAIDADMRYMQEIGVIEEEGMMGEGEYDDDDAFESLLDMLAGDEEDEDQMGVIAQMLDAYMTAQQRFLEESGLME